MHVSSVSYTDFTRHRTVQALSPVLLESEVRKLESEGWLRVGGIALATPVAETQPPYRVQAMSRDPFPDSGPNGNGRSSRPPAS